MLTKLLLKFDLIIHLLSHLGLENPHTPYETELLLAGVKPIAILHWSRLDSAIKQALSEGQLIQIAKINLMQDQCLYYRSEHESYAKEAAEILGKHETERTKAETSFLNQNIYGEQMKVFPRKPGVVGQKDIQRHCPKALIKGEIKIMQPFLAQVPSAEQTLLKNAVQKEELDIIHFKCPLRNYVIAQSNKLEEGKELYACYSHKNTDQQYLPMSIPEETRRVGLLLGYTENDILQWNKGNRFYNNFLIRIIMEATQELRLQARRKSLLAQRKDPLLKTGKLDI